MKVNSKYMQESEKKYILMAIADKKTQYMEKEKCLALEEMEDGKVQFVNDYELYSTNKAICEKVINIMNKNTCQDIF